MESARDRWAFWWKWVLAFVVSSGLSVGCVTFGLLGMMGGMLRHSSIGLLGFAFIAVLCLGFIGVVIGAVQQMVLWPYLENVDGWWAVTSWSIMLASLVPLAIELTGFSEYLPGPVWATGWMGIGMLGGLIVGGLQFLVLQGNTPEASTWIPVSVLATGVAGAVYTLLAREGAPIVSIIASLCMYAGITGLGLASILPERAALPPGESIRRWIGQYPVRVVGWLWPITFALLLAWGIWHNVRLSTEIPDYPNAQEVRTSEPAEEDIFTEQVMTFSISDPPLDVLVFYRNTLEDQGWEYRTFDTTVGPTGEFEGILLTYSTCPYLSIRVTAKAQGERTKVEVQRSSSPCL